MRILQDRQLAIDILKPEQVHENGCDWNSSDGLHAVSFLGKLPDDKLLVFITPALHLPS